MADKEGMVTLKLMQRLKALFESKQSVSTQQTNRRPLPSDPDFDIHLWLAEHPESADELPNVCVPGARALRLGFSDRVIQKKMPSKIGGGTRWCVRRKKQRASQQHHITMYPDSIKARFVKGKIRRQML